MKTPSRRHQGFSLVEILVGLLMGMLAMIVVMQVFALSEGTKRTTTGGADATTNAVTALHLMQQDIKLAGWGLDATLYLGRPANTGKINPTMPGCTTINAYCSGHSSCGGTAGDIANFSLASVFIVNGANGGPDTLSVRFFTDPDVGDQVLNAPAKITENKVTGGVPQLTVGSHYGCKSGDLILVSDPTNTANSTCSILQASAAPGLPTPPAVTPYTLTHQSKALADANAIKGAFNKADWDTAEAGKPLNLTPTTFATCFTPAPANGPLFQRTYSIDAVNRQLQLTDNTAKTRGVVGGKVTSTYTPITNQTIASGIMDMQAQYGVSVDGSATQSSQQVTSANWKDADRDWNNPIPKAGVTDDATITANRLQNIKAVRVAILARSSQYEKPTSVDGACNATPADAGHVRDADHPNGWSAWATFNTANYPADWQCYRYKAFELIIPLRNILWANV